MSMTLEQWVQILEDIQVITELKAAYCNAADGGWDRPSHDADTGYTVPFWRTEHRGGAPELSAPVFTTHKVGQRIVVCLERESRRTEDGILILPAAEFCVRLGAGDLF